MKVVDGFVVEWVVGWKEKNGERDCFCREKGRREGRGEKGRGVIKMVSGNSS